MLSRSSSPESIPSASISSEVITETGKLVEVQMTSEKKLCSEKSFNAMLQLAKSGITKIIQIQKKTISG